MKNSDRFHGTKALTGIALLETKQKGRIPRGGSANIIYIVAVLFAAVGIRRVCVCVKMAFAPSCLVAALRGDLSVNPTSRLSNRQAVTCSEGKYRGASSASRVSNRA